MKKNETLKEIATVKVKGYHGDSVYFRIEKSRIKKQYYYLNIIILDNYINNIINDPSKSIGKNYKWIFYKLSTRKYDFSNFTVDVLERVKYVEIPEYFFLLLESSDKLNLSLASVIFKQIFPNYYEYLRSPIKWKKK